MKIKNIVAVTVLLVIFGCASKIPLIEASKAGDSMAVQKLLDAGANVNEPDRRGYSALFYTIEYGQLEVVKSLIKMGANIESKESSGMTPLVYAIYYDFDSPNAANIMKLLIESGANINAKSPYGETITDLALSSIKGDIVDILIKSRNINLWMPETGKARIIFVCTDLYDHISVTVGKQTKQLNQHTGPGVAFIDVNPGKHFIDANHSNKYVSKNRQSIEVKTGQTYYYKVTQNLRNRIVGYALVVPSTLIDQLTSNPFLITPLNESEAKREIIEILKSKELIESK